MVGYIGDKPHQIVIELENSFAHISQYFNPELDIQDKDKNLAKAYDHLVRATLDCYKLLWVTLHEQLKAIEEDESIRKLGLNISAVTRSYIINCLVLPLPSGVILLRYASVVMLGCRALRTIWRNLIV